MRFPPRPTVQEYEDALSRIHGRRRRAGDDHHLALSEDPREVLAYLRKRGRNGLVVDETGDDITDALILKLWLWWENEEVELWLLEAAEHLKRSRRSICQVLGLGAGQSLVDRIKRGRRIFKREVVTTTPPVASSQDADLRAIAMALVEQQDDIPDDVDRMYVENIAEALPRWPPGRPAPTEGVALAVRILLGDLDDEVPAGAPLRDLVDRGMRAVGVRRVRVSVDDGISPEQ